MRPPFVQPDTRFAEIPQRFLTMRNHDQAGLSGQVLERFLCLLSERGIADGGNLVGDIDVKVKGQGKCKLQARLHP